MGNSIIDGYLQEADEKTFYSIDANKNCILPERVWAKENSITKKNVALYRDFYFHTSQPIDFLSKNGGLIYLHNSWTPREYMQMSEEEFLRQENTLASVFKSILGFE